MAHGSAWCWQNGPDLVLRAMAPLCRDGRLRVVFVGQGPQEDELRYLVHFLGLEGRVRLVVADPAAYPRAHQADAVVDISDAQREGWRVMREGVLVDHLQFGNLNGLREAVLGLVEEGVPAK